MQSNLHLLDHIECRRIRSMPVYTWDREPKGHFHPQPDFADECYQVCYGRLHGVMVMAPKQAPGEGVEE